MYLQGFLLLINVYLTIPRICEGIQTADGVHRRVRRDTVRDPLRKWPKGLVPFNFSPKAGIQTRSAFQGAVKEIEKVSCVRFVKRTYQRDYVTIITGDGCYSIIGRDGGQQVLSLGTGCYRKGIALHEVMHLLGFFHEQSRLDRNEHVIVNYQNAAFDARRQFKQYRAIDADTQGEGYDPDSIMHYSNNAFSKNGLPTLIYKKNPRKKLGQRNGLSAIDIRQLNKLYGCPVKYLNNSVIMKFENESNREPVIDNCRDHPSVSTTNFCLFSKLIGDCYFSTTKMAYLCPRTCLYCRPTCVNTSPYCQYFGFYGYCISSETVQKRCRKTCGLCRVAY